MQINQIEWQRLAVVDKQLQDIADKWNTDGMNAYLGRVSLERWWPSLAALLDTLTKED